MEDRPRKGLRHEHDISLLYFSLVIWSQEFIVQLACTSTCDPRRTRVMWVVHLLEGVDPSHCIGRQNDRDSMKWGPTRSETSHRSLDRPNPTPLMMGLVNEPRSSHCCSNTWYITLLSHPAVNYFGLQLLGCPLAVKGDE